MQGKPLTGLQHAQHWVFVIARIEIIFFREKFYVQLYSRFFADSYVGPFGGLIAFLIEFHRHLCRRQLGKTKIAVRIGEYFFLIVGAGDGGGDDDAGKRFFGDGVRYVAVQHAFNLTYTYASFRAKRDREKQQQYT